MMVIPFGEGDIQEMIRIKRLDNNEFEKETFSTLLCANVERCRRRLKQFKKNNDE